MYGSLKGLIVLFLNTSSGGDGTNDWGKNFIELRKTLKSCFLRQKSEEVHVNLDHCQMIEIDFSLIWYDASVSINVRLND